VIRILAVLLPLQQQPVISGEALEARIFDLINRERMEHKLRPVRQNEKLTTLARNFSRDMARRSFFDHTDPDGKTPVQRGMAANVPCRRGTSFMVAENIFQNNLYDRVFYRNDVPTYEWNTLEDIAKSTVDGWMNSPGHRKVILTKELRIAGVGVTIAPNDQVLITQEFC
jgi:uncharacterized protein YkwD